jgi:hypothetical protein
MQGTDRWKGLTPLKAITATVWAGSRAVWGAVAETWAGFKMARSYHIMSFGTLSLTALKPDTSSCSGVQHKQPRKSRDERLAFIMPGQTGVSR